MRDAADVVEDVLAMTTLMFRIETTLAVVEEYTKSAAKAILASPSA